MNSVSDIASRARLMCSITVFRPPVAGLRKPEKGLKLLDVGSRFIGYLVAGLRKPEKGLKLGGGAPEYGDHLRRRTQKTREGIETRKSRCSLTISCIVAGLRKPEKGLKRSDFPR